MEELSLENILQSEDIDALFTDDEDTQDDSNNDIVDSPDKKETKEETTEVDVDDLFAEKPESVGSEEKEENKEEEGTKSDEDLDTSPNNNFYSSIAKALKKDSIFPDLDDELINSIKNPEDFAEAVEKQIQSKLDEKQRRIDEALNVGVEPSAIKNYENTINYLNSITEEDLIEESDNGENLRRQLIYQDFINRGYSKERAEREVKKSFNSGSDIDDAKDALSSTKEYFTNEYNNLIEEAKEEKRKETQERKNKIESLKKSILEDSTVFGDIKVDKTTRQKVLDNISKPVYKDPDTGELYTAIQKYEKENSIDFIKKVGLLFTLTNGFKDFNGLIKDKVRKEVNKGIRDLEHTMNNTFRTSNGSLKFASGVDDPESSSKPWSIDV